MGEVGFEAIPGEELACEWLEHLEVELDVSAATTADHVVMRRFVGALILGNAVVKCVWRTAPSSSSTSRVR